MYFRRRFQQVLDNHRERTRHYQEMNYQTHLPVTHMPSLNNGRSITVSSERVSAAYSRYPVTLSYQQAMLRRTPVYQPPTILSYLPPTLFWPPERNTVIVATTEIGGYEHEFNSELVVQSSQFLPQERCIARRQNATNVIPVQESNQHVMSQSV